MINTEHEYLLSINEIEDYISRGYQPSNDLRLALQHGLLFRYEDNRIYIDHKKKWIDTYLYYWEDRFPHLDEYGFDPNEQFHTQQRINIFGYYYCC